MKKCCHITSAHPVFDTRIFYKQCRTLTQAGYNVSLIAPHTQDETVESIKIIGLAQAKNRWQRLLTSNLKILWRAYQQKADIYHLHDPELLPLGVILKLLGNRKVIYDVHENYSQQTLFKEYLPLISRKSIALIIKIVESLSSKLFDGIICATDDILKNFSSHSRALTVKNFPILDDFLKLGSQSDKQVAQQLTTSSKLSQKSKTFKLIYIGGLNPVKGISQIIQALQLIENQYPVKLVLAGKFDSPDYQAQIIKQCQNSTNISYFGQIPSQNIPRLLSQVDAGICCLQPIRNYLTSLPVKLFEYMAAGLPVIVSNFTLWQRIIKGNQCGLCVNPLKPKEIAQAIEYLITHPKETITMGNNGREAVLKKYHWAKQGQKLLWLYSQILKT